MIADLFLIAFICVFIIDYSGFMEEAGKALTRALKSKVPLHIPKPFGCSLCATWWTCLIWLICTSNLTLLNIAAAGAAGAVTPEILALVYFLKDCLGKPIALLSKWLRL